MCDSFCCQNVMFLDFLTAYCGEKHLLTPSYPLVPDGVGTRSDTRRYRTLL